MGCSGGSSGGDAAAQTFNTVDFFPLSSILRNFPFLTSFSICISQTLANLLSRQPIFQLKVDLISSNPCSRALP
jgi:hypothetical protein